MGEDNVGFPEERSFNTDFTLASVSGDSLVTLDKGKLQLQPEAASN